MKMAGQLSPAYFLYQSLWQALDWLFPPTCGGCSQTGVTWCAACQNQVVRIAQPVCPRCGDPRPENDGPCPDCLAHPPEYEQLRSFAVFQGPLREALHRRPYHGDIGLGRPLSKHLIEYYNDLKWDIDLVAPVPLSKKRMRERGYNQSGALGRPLAYAIQKPFETGALQRTRNTQSQVGLSAANRQKNVEDAFSAKREKVQGKVILVIDDVSTTGSTINACARALRLAGASAVYGLTLARSVLQADADDQPKPLI